MIKHWSFSLLLGAIYLLIFNLWLFLSPGWIVTSGIAACLALLALFTHAVRRHYFINFWDGLLHFVVIIDVFLEATFISIHQAAGFYLCALALAIVIAGYRFYARRRQFLRI